MQDRLQGPAVVVVASMGPPSDKGGYAERIRAELAVVVASMGPPSDKGGYAFPR